MNAWEQEESQVRNQVERSPNEPTIVARAAGIALMVDRIVADIAERVSGELLWLASRARFASASVVLHLTRARESSVYDQVSFLDIASGMALDIDATISQLEHAGGCTEKQRRDVRVLTLRLVTLLGHVESPRLMD